MPAAKVDGRKAKGKRKRGKGMLGVKEVETVQKMAEALDYRLQSYSFAEIGEAMGVSTTRAYELVDMALKQTIHETADKVRQMELRRLDKMTPKMMEFAVQGDPKAVDSVIKIMDRRAKLLGLDGPSKHEHTGKDGGPIETKVNGDSARSALVEALAKAGYAGTTPESDPEPRT
jgi:hypothetical protein